MNNQFLGEHLLPGQLGHFFVYVSLFASFISTFYYLWSVKTETTNINKRISYLFLARYAFILHCLSVVGIFSALYYIIANHLFEYHYAWEHSSRSLPVKYLLSCFWEGQQGSFMLWTFWNCVLGLVVIKTAKELETRTMTIISLVQFFLCTMLLGINITADIKLGTTPFELLRVVMQNAPIFSNHNYMQYVKDGNGLNVLLQNYWMVIHPPILFLGFSATLIPFAYIISALWKGDYISFIKPVLVWSLFGGAVLGAGIIMGGAWAYESLNFGGYWAWDPVENASLVPWITLIAAIHTLIEYKNTGRALFLTFVLLLVTHLLVWYSTFLTRTGILGSTSVHAFTGEGASLFYHLLVVIGLLLVITILFLVINYKKLPQIKTEENFVTREFWLFIGAAILFISAVHITIMTSIPVWAPVAKYFTKKDFALLDPINHYNNVEVWIAVFIGFFSGAVLYMKYKTTDLKVFFKRVAIPKLVAILLCGFIAYTQKIDKFQYILMLYASCFGITANLYYAITVQKLYFRKLGSSISHFGFAMVLLGILLSSFNKHVLSKGKMRDNVLLYLNKPVQMGDYMVTYMGDSTENGKDIRNFYKVNFTKYDNASNNITEQFILYPDAYINPKGMNGLTANPATKHYWNKDIFTYISAVFSKGNDTATYKSASVSNLNDTIFLKDAYMIYNGFSKLENDVRYKLSENDLGIMALFNVIDLNGKQIKYVKPVYILRNKQYSELIEDTVSTIGLYIKYNLKVTGYANPVSEIMYKQINNNDKYIVLKALEFPFINVLWIGVVIMITGFTISIFNRITQKNIIKI